eukprot:TRINITY_DN412_c0_g1_i3.p1 TRINITY_DN412_c0_g1~~TRINITY_DN412_c0_g1_i3.p1  ORF type:complete len:102 (+),score=12.92 TRINITY_DN412_c0_g1_i3:100-405(+)
MSGRNVKPRVFLRFNRPWDYRSTKPGFMSPWSSQDLFQEVPQGYIWKTIVFFTVATCLIQPATLYLFGRHKTGQPVWTTSPEWYAGIDERNRREGLIEDGH